MCRIIRTFAFVLIFASAVASATADPADAVVHPVSGEVEIVASVDDGNGDMDVQYTLDTGQGPGTPSWLATNSDDDHGPRVEFDTTSKDLYLAWWREGSSSDSIWARIRDDSTDSWGSEVQQTDPNESARNPELAFDGSDLWMAYEYDATGGIGIRVGIITEGPDPYNSHVALGVATLSGDVDVVMHTESGHAWVTWVDDSDDVGWADYDASTETWNTTQYESYASDSVEMARRRIRDAIVDP